MATRKISVRTVVNRKALTAIREAHVAALEDMGQQLLAVAKVPDDPPYGVGMIQTGTYGVWSDGRKVAGLARKPRGVRLPTSGVVMVAGYGFPAHFLEFGTIRMRPQPFVTPAALEVVPQAKTHLSFRLRKALAGFR